MGSPARNSMRDPTDTGVRVWVKATQFPTCSTPAENNHRRGVYHRSSLNLTCLLAGVTHNRDQGMSIGMGQAHFTLSSPAFHIYKGE